MAMHKHLHEKIDTLDLVEKRFEVMVGAKLVDSNKSGEAASVQDKLRKKSKNWDGAAEIKKWRQAR